MHHITVSINLRVFHKCFLLHNYELICTLPIINNQIATVPYNGLKRECTWLSVSNIKLMGQIASDIK